MRSFWSLSLQRQLAIAIGLVLVPVLVAAVWSGMSTFRERAAELGDQTRVIAFTTAAYINRDLTNLDGTVRGLESNPDIQSMNPALSTELLRRVTPGLPMVAAVTLVSRAGDVVANVTSSPAPDIKDDSHDWATPVFGTGQRSMSSLRVTPSGLHYVVLGYPVRDALQKEIGAT